MLLLVLALLLYLLKIRLSWVYLKAERGDQLDGYNLQLLLKVVFWEGQNPAQHSKQGNEIVEGLNEVLFTVLLPHLYWPKKSDSAFIVKWRLVLMGLSVLSLTLLILGLFYV